MDGTSIADKIRAIENKIKLARQKTQDPAGPVQLVAVSKFHSEGAIRQAFAAGLTLFGENYVQEAQKKMKALEDLSLEWHFIGNIQSNKIKHLVGPFSLIQSVDQMEHIKKISQIAHQQGIRQKILIQVNVAKEKTKSGVLLDDLVPFMEQAGCEHGVQVMGLMCLPPLEMNVLEKRKIFQTMKRVFDEQREKFKLSILSMGTSHDFEIAIEEGANMVRIGTEIFGPRPRI